MKSLKVDTLPAPDGVYPGILKEITEEVVEIMVVIFQDSLETGRVTEDRKMANVTSLFKKGGRQKTGNYRTKNKENYSTGTGPSALQACLIQIPYLNLSPIFQGSVSFCSLPI
eukprot:g19857.t1